MPKGIRDGTTRDSRVWGPTPAISRILCIDLEEISKFLHALVWIKTQPGKPCVVSVSSDDGLLYLRVPY